jgi:hypothetical protein
MKWALLGGMVMAVWMLWPVMPRDAAFNRQLNEIKQAFAGLGQ